MEILDIHRRYGTKRPDTGLPESEIARRLKMMRKSKNMSQLEVADRIGVSRTAYLKYESGKGGIPGRSLLNLAELFETTTDFLLGRGKPEPSEERCASETAKEEAAPVEYIPKKYYQLVSLINTMNDDSIDMMLSIAKVIKGHQGKIKDWEGAYNG